MQTTIAILLVLGCTAYVARQLFRTVNAGGGKAGACCAKGCDAKPPVSAVPQRGGEQFISSDLLRKRR